jgi:hypothetical protein
MKWYLGGFGAIGLLTGLYTGMSDSPVAATVLPLLFSLVVGTGGVYLAKGDFRSEVGRQRFQFIGIALTGFAVASLFAALGGISIRTGAGLLSFIPFKQKEGQAALPSKVDIPPTRLMQLTIYRAELEAIGVRREEQSRLLEKFVYLPESNSSFRMHLDPAEILSVTASLSTALDKALNHNRTLGKEVDPPSEVTRLQYMLPGAIIILRSYITQKPEEKIRDLEGIRAMVQRIHDAVNAAIGERRSSDDKTVDWLRVHGVPYELLEEVSIATEGNQRNGDYDLGETNSPEEQLFQLVKVMRAPASKPPNAEDNESTQRTVSSHASIKR